MRVERRQTILFSRAERRVKLRLEQRWLPRFQVYPNLPLTTLLDFKTLDVREQAFVHKASVDFTLAEAGTDRPILSVEFDGYGDGTEVRGTYRLGPNAGGDAEKRDRRVWSLNFKLRAAAAARYPIIVISSSDMTPIGGGFDLSLFDVVISEALVNQRADDLRTRGIEEHMEYNDTITEDEFETIDIGAGIDAESELGIVDGHLEGLAREAKGLGLPLPFPLQFGGDIRYGALHLQLLEDPPESPQERADLAAEGLWGPAMLRRIDRIQRLERWGALATFQESPEVTHVGRGSIWVRNTAVVWAPAVAQKIAALLLYRGIVRSLRERKQHA